MSDPGTVRYLAPKTMTDPEPALPRSDGVRHTTISSENQEAISKFLKSSVLPSTDRKYELQWGRFVQFMKDQGSDDPSMRTLTPQERTGMVSLFMISRHVAGRGASGIGGHGSNSLAFLSGDGGHSVPGFGGRVISTDCLLPQSPGVTQTAQQRASEFGETSDLL
jgi:hypothetical protein